MDHGREKRDVLADDGKDAYAWPPPDEVLQEIVSVDLATGELAPLKLDALDGSARRILEERTTSPEHGAKSADADRGNDVSLVEISRYRLSPPGRDSKPAMPAADVPPPPRRRPVSSTAGQPRAPILPVPPRRSPKRTRTYWLIAALAVLALGEGIFIAWKFAPAPRAGVAAVIPAPVSDTADRASTTGRAAPPGTTDSKGTTGQSASLAIRSHPTGARVWIDGRPRGQTPLTVGQLSPGQHELILQGATGRVQQRVDLEPGVKSTVVATLAGVVSGGIAVTSPVELQIMERGRRVGSTRTDKILLNPGRHTIDLVNEALGYQSRQVVDVVAGKTTAIAPTLPNGTLSVNALPWAEVLLDGQQIGQTPLGNLPVRIGSHEVTFRHPELGETKRTVMVTLRAPARVSVDFQRLAR
jgi:hypothetical protein